MGGACQCAGPAGAGTRSARDRTTITPVNATSAPDVMSVTEMPLVAQGLAAGSIYVADNYGDGLHIPVAHPGLTRLFAGRTVIAIAHRLSTVNAFDRIVVLDKGRIVEHGPPTELLGRESIYSRMYTRQISAARHA